MAYVYRHIRLDSRTPFYIGVGGLISDDKLYRAYKKCNRSKFWKSIVDKAGYEVEILIDNTSPEIALWNESYFVKLYGRIDNGTGILVNHTDGGEGCVNMKHSENVKKAQSLRVSGVRHPNYGKKIPESVKEKVRKKLSGRENIEHSQRMKGNLNSAKKVIDTKTGVVYHSAKQAADSIGLKYSTLRAMLNGYNPNKTNLCTFK